MFHSPKIRILGHLIKIKCRSAHLSKLSIVVPIYPYLIHVNLIITPPIPQNPLTESVYPNFPKIMCREAKFPLPWGVQHTKTIVVRPISQNR